MATYTGYVAQTAEFGYSATDRPDWYITNGWGARWGENWGGNADYFQRGWGRDWGNDWGESTATGFLPRTGREYGDVTVAMAGAYTDNRPIPLREYALSGSSGGSFSADFYNRIYQAPGLLDFGSVVSEQVLDFTVWNAYFTPKNLLNVIETDFDSGTQFSGQTTPSIFSALEQRTYQITVGIGGPPTIDAAITFDWEVGIDSTSTDIVGTRVLLLPIVFSANTQEALEFKTNVLNSWNGTEQRIRQRSAPRQQFAIRAFSPRSEMHKIDNLLYQFRQQLWVLGLWTEARTGDPITSGDTVVDVDTQYGDFRVNSLAIAWESPSKYDVFQITAKTDSTLTAASPIANDYSAPAIMPVRSVRILGDPTRTTSGYDSVLNITVEVIDNIVLPTSPSTQQFLGEDTYFEEPWASTSDGVPDSYQHKISAVDFQTGAVEIFAPWDNIRVGRTVEFLFEGKQAIWEFREWLHRRAGKLVPFYYPTFENNFKLVTTGTIGNAFEAVDYGYDFGISGRDHIVFRLADGTWEPRTIINAVVVGDNVQITLDTALNEPVANIIDVGFFGLKRLGTDKITMTWLPNNVLSVTLTILEIAP